MAPSSNPRVSLALASMALLSACSGPTAMTPGASGGAVAAVAASWGPGEGQFLRLEGRQGEALGQGHELTVALALASQAWNAQVAVGMGAPGAPALAGLVGPPAAALRLQGLGASPPQGQPLPSRGGFGHHHAYQGAWRALAPRPVAPPRALLAAAPRVLGSSDRFWINTSMTGATGDHERSCVLRRISEHAYLYVDAVSQRVTEAQLDELIEAFERDMVGPETRVFGPIPNPGVDGDPRVFIVLSPTVDDDGQDKGMMGYFWSRDAIPGFPGRTNQKEVLFMTDRLFEYPRLTAFGTLAHEFQHLLNFSKKAAANGYTLAEDTWLDEGLSMLAMDLAGYGMQAGDLHVAKDLNEFQKAPELYSLTDWGGNPRGFAYGLVYLFVRYLKDRHGEAAIRALLEGQAVGVAKVDEVLKARGSDFATFFQDWAAANLYNDAPVSQGSPYRYSGLALNAAYGGFQLSGFQPRPLAGGREILKLRPYGMAFVQGQSAAGQAWALGTRGEPKEAVRGVALLR